jgi:SagB-type dehydrogenase family enzyme
LTENNVNQPMTAGIRAYHEATKHSPESVRRPGRGLDWANQPSPYKDYEPDLEAIPLPMPEAQLPVSALDAIAGRRPSAPAALDAAGVGRILNYGAGVMRRWPISHARAMYFRTYASAGGLYPVEVYAVTGDVAGVGAGVFHYHPRRRQLGRMREGDHRGALVAATASEPAVSEAPLVLVLSGIPWRTAWKYGPRGFRHLWWDAGTMLANLLALCAASGLAARVVLGFDDEAVGRLLGLDGRREFPLALLAIGKGEPAPAAVPLTELALPSRPLSHDEIEYPATLAAHDSGRLTAADVEGWRRAAGIPRGGAAPGPAPGPPDLLEAVIRRRGSARSFDRMPVPAELLADILERAAWGVPADVAPEGSRLTRPYLIANRVEGLEPGAYVYEGGLRLLGPGDFAEQAAYLCLEQWLAHDAAATHFLMADLEATLGLLGDRGYRVAQLEAGVVAGRMYLGAYAHRLGATGLTFYDDEVTRFFATPGEPDRSCMLAVAVGPSTRRLLPLA